MGKLGLFGTSLVGAIPAGIGLYFLVMVFLSHGEDLSGMLLVVTAVTLLACAVLVVIPILALIFTPKSPNRVVSAKNAPANRPAAAAAPAAAAGGNDFGGDDFGDDGFEDDFDDDFGDDFAEDFDDDF